jgi:hypothetical protein
MTAYRRRWRGSKRPDAIIRVGDTSYINFLPVSFLDYGSVFTRQIRQYKDLATRVGRYNAIMSYKCSYALLNHCHE